MADLRDLRNQIRVRAYFAVSDASPRLEQMLRQTSPRDTGLMQSRTTVVPRGLEATAKADTKYASFVKDGTRPHVIRAKKGKLLSFYWPKAGKQMFLAKVNHPGTKANGWWNAGLNRWSSLLQESLRRAPNG